jgi:small subunit ribosomal protein S6
MMNQYELMVIFTPILSEDEQKKIVEKYGQFVADNGGEMVHQETWGLRQFAYPIDKKTTGIYQLYEFKAPGDIVGKMEIQFGRDDSVMRWMFTRLDKYGVEYSQRRRNKLAQKDSAKAEKQEA